MFTKRVKAALVAALLPIVAVCVATQPATAQLSVPPPIQSYAGDPGTLGDPASWRTPEFLRDYRGNRVTLTVMREVPH